MTHRIKMIVPVPVPQQALAAFADQIPAGLVRPDIAIEFACAARGGGTLDSLYEGTIADAFCLEAGCRAEEEGFSAVCINSMSDSGVAALRSRLTIPVVGTAQATYHLACQLGKKFAILSMWDNWRWLYDKVLTEQGLQDRLSPMRMDAARRAIEEDGADVLVLGSTTMHQSHAYLAAHLPVPVLNPGLVAFKACETLIDLGLSHSRKGFAPPERIIDNVFEAA